MPVWVSLLRGVNLGAHNKVNMPRLREALTAAGFTDVRTYVQSGNLVAGSGHRKPHGVAEAIRGVVLAEFAVDVPVIVRTPAQLRAVLDWCPFPRDAADRPAQVHVIHLAAEPDPERVADLRAEAGAWAPDALAVCGPEVVIRYAETMHASKLQYPKILKRLAVDGTARNWRTLTALVELSAG